MSLPQVSLDPILSKQTNSGYCFFKGKTVLINQLFNHALYISEALSEKRFFINLCHDRYFFVKQMYRQGKINKLDYNAQVRKLKHQMKSELVDLKTLYKKGEINKHNYVRRVNEIKYRYKR